MARSSMLTVPQLLCQPLLSVEGVRKGCEKTHHRLQYSRDNLTGFAGDELSVAPLYFLIDKIHCLSFKQSHLNSFFFLIIKLWNLGSCPGLTMLKPVQMPAKMLLKKPLLVSAQHLI